MKIDICSDLHTDFWKNNTWKMPVLGGPRKRNKDGTYLYLDWEWYKKQTNQNSEILIIAGDMSDDIELTKKIIEQAAKVYNHVIYCDGNHDHYGKKSYSENMIKFEKNNENILFLTTNSTGYIIDDLAIVGCNGWYTWDCYESIGISKDAARIDWGDSMLDKSEMLFDLGLPDKLAIEQAAALEKTITSLQENDEIKEIVVVTHTSPLAILMQWKDDKTWDNGTPSFVNSEMSKVIQSDYNRKIKYWIYGHTHHRQTIDIDGITFINNCRGYPAEIKGEWSLQTIDIGKP